MKVIAIYFFMMLLFESAVFALPMGVHKIISYEASLLQGVPSEIGVYVGVPEACTFGFRDSICEGVYDEDAGRDPRTNPANPFSWLGMLNWGTHFWDPDEGHSGGLLEEVDGIPVNLESKNAFQRAWELYQSAVSIYSTDPLAAYYLLGRAIHLIGDMATPAHVHLDPHISDAAVTGDDSFEEYLDVRYGNDLAGLMEFERDFPLFGLIPVGYDDLPDEGYPEGPLLYRVFFSMAHTSKGYDSDDADGRVDEGIRRGMSIKPSKDISGLKYVMILRPGYPGEMLLKGYQLSPARGKFILYNSVLQQLINAVPPYEEISLGFPDGSVVHQLAEFNNSDIGDSDASEIAGILIPSAIKHTAAVYQLFWRETHPTLNDDIPVVTLNGGEQRLYVTKPEPVDIVIDIASMEWSGTDVEVYAWLDASLNGERVRLYFLDGVWHPFNGYQEMRPAIPLYRLYDISGFTWNLLEDTSMLPGVAFNINLCLDRCIDGLYTPAESVCEGVYIRAVD